MCSTLDEAKYAAYYLYSSLFAINLHTQVVMMKFAPTQLSTFLDSVRKWTPSRRATTSRPSLTRMVTAPTRTSSTLPPLGVWWVQRGVWQHMSVAQGPVGMKYRYTGSGICQTLASFVVSVMWQQYQYCEGPTQSVNTNSCTVI